MNVGDLVRIQPSDSRWVKPEPPKIGDLVCTSNRIGLVVDIELAVESTNSDPWFMAIHWVHSDSGKPPPHAARMLRYEAGELELLSKA